MRFPDAKEEERAVVGGRDEVSSLLLLLLSSVTSKASSLLSFCCCSCWILIFEDAVSSSCSWIILSMIGLAAMTSRRMKDDSVEDGDDVCSFCLTFLLLLFGSILVLTTGSAFCCFPLAAFFGETAFEDDFDFVVAEEALFFSTGADFSEAAGFDDDFELFVAAAFEGALVFVLVDFVLAPRRDSLRKPEMREATVAVEEEETTDFAAEERNGSMI